MWRCVRAAAALAVAAELLVALAGRRRGTGGPRAALLSWGAGADRGERSTRCLIALLERARSHVSACVLLMCSARAAEALGRAAGSGAAVRALLDADLAHNSGSRAHWLRQRGALVRAGALVHHKFCVLDRRLLLCGSLNWTRHALHRNYENVLVTEDPDLVRAFEAEFEYMWERFEPLEDHIPDSEVERSLD